MCWSWKCTCFSGVCSHQPHPPLQISLKFTFLQKLLLSAWVLVCSRHRTLEGVTCCLSTISAKFQELNTLLFFGQSSIISSLEKKNQNSTTTNKPEFSQLLYHVTFERTPDTRIIKICFLDAMKLEVLNRTGMMDHCYYISPWKISSLYSTP